MRGLLSLLAIGAPEVAAGLESYTDSVSYKDRPVDVRYPREEECLNIHFIKSTPVY